ncbi:MAG: hypothetical protein A2W03_02525 [Candidatus Aminicenantes bacterium RBG_16_63_16]|nr:MAG: hypothetical protein A2W03_02525 [Candidatus Aminicenantes bacterium RBG_16_63_16]
MKAKSLAALAALLLALAPAAFSQSRETGAIVGTITDQQGEALPGVTVTVSGTNLMGTRTFVTDRQGSYRFPALPPGVYSVKAELQGFKTVIREDIRLTTTTRLTADLAMVQSVVEEEVTVQAHSPTVDIKSTETASVTLSNEILRNIPYSQFTADIVNMAPGVNDNVAFGASSDTGIAYTVDGVNVADPDAGSAWVFLDHNIIEEAKVMGVGLPAEYGNFTGVIFNLVTKSGGNQLSGHFEFDFQGKKSDAPKGLWGTDNNSQFIEDFPDLTTPLNKLLDVNAHLGGPIKKDKLWFYVGLQYYHQQRYPAGFPEALDYKEPRSFFKLTSQLTPSTNLTASVEVDTYLRKNRDGSATVTPEATVEQVSPEVVANFSLTHIFGANSFFDVKGAYFWGYYYLDPTTGKDLHTHLELSTNRWLYNSGYFYYADRSRLQVNASYTHYAEDFIRGNHDFKFGVEVERSGTRSRYGYTGNGQDALFGNTGLPFTQFQDYYGEPYLAYQYEGYDKNSPYTRIEGFAQDSWQITSRLNLNLGVRLSQNWGFVKGVSGAVYKTFRVAPRLGFTYDILGDKTTVFKAHYGRYTEGMFASYHDRLNPASAFKDSVGYYWDTDFHEWVEFSRTVYEELYKVADNIKHPYMNQFVVGIERELFKDTSFSVNYINRRWNDIIGLYDKLADYDPYTVTVRDLNNKQFQIWERTDETVDTHEYIIANIKKGDPWISLDPYRKYWGLEFVFNKRFSNRWQLLASYVYSKATGTIDNGMADDIGYGSRRSMNTDDPNFWISDEGNLTYDPTHQIKVQGTYILPLGISFSAYYRGITGEAWTTEYRTPRLNQGRVTFLAEPRGANHYKMTNLLDLRLEKIFTLQSRYRLGVIFDVFNLFNDSTITSWGTRIGYDWTPGDYPSSDGHEVLSLPNARQARVGIRLIF